MSWPSIKLGLTHFMDTIWGIFKHAGFYFTPGNQNKIVNMSGENVTIKGPTTKIENYIGTLYVICDQIEDFAERNPESGYRLKHSIKAAAFNARTLGTHKNLEHTTLGPFVTANFKNHTGDTS